MSIADWVQVISVMLLAGALILSVYQMQQILRQTATMRVEHFNNLSTSIMQAHTDQRATFLLHDPDLLEWYLNQRGYRTTTEGENRRRLFALVKFDTHESIYLRNVKGMMDESMWRAWRRVLEVDLTVPIFPDVWGNGRQFYDERFAQFVDSLLEEIRQASSGPI
jgi:succinate dehydrogenase flavin-adding protein (antitoxin of CptAB toxin-antitoxin module)